MELKRELTERQRALLWLSAAEVTAERVRQLTEEFGSPEEVYQAFGRENGPQFQARACERLKKIHPADELSAWAEKLEQSHVHLLFRTMRNIRSGCAPLTIFPTCCTMQAGFPA